MSTDTKTTDHKTSEELVNEQWKSNHQHIKEESAEDVLQNALEIKRKQSLINGEWQTTSFTLVLTIGGPHVEVNTNGALTVRWGGDSKVMAMGPQATKKMEQVHESLSHLYE